MTRWIVCWWRLLKLRRLRKVRKQTALLLKLWRDHSESADEFKASALLSVQLREAVSKKEAVLRARYFHCTARVREREEW